MYEFLALGTAFLRVVTRLIHADLSRSLGGAAYNRLRLTIMAFVMPAVVFFGADGRLLIVQVWFL